MLKFILAMALCVCAYAQEEGQEIAAADDVASVENNTDSLQRAFDCGCGGKKK
jgi:hypothetical protein